MFALTSNNSFGDFATLSNYTWTASAKRQWREHKTLPVKLSDLPKHEKLVTYTFHVTRYRCADGCIRITKADFDRLEATPKATASLWHETDEFVSYVFRSCPCHE